MSYRHVKIPESGQKITVSDDRLNVPDNPILGFVEGDGIGPDITRAAMRVWNAAVDKAYGGKRKVHWAELYLGEKPLVFTRAIIFRPKHWMPLRN